MENPQIVQKARYGRYIASVVIAAIVLLLVRAFAIGNIDWKIVGKHLFSVDMLYGIVNTIILTVCAMLIGIVLGMVSALMKQSSNPVLRYTAQAYIFIFRAVPVLLQLLIWYNLALVFPTVSIPFLFSVPATNVFTPFTAALLGFGIQNGAYTSEVIRSGLLSVGRAQAEAAKSIGMTQFQSLRRVIMPQAMRVMIPPIGNETIGMVKYTSIASVIQYQDIIYQVQSIYFITGTVIELLIVAAFWYVIVVFILSTVQWRIEQHFGKSDAQSEGV
jgi:polar amino acid transport system permease protein